MVSATSVRNKLEVKVFSKIGQTVLHTPYASSSSSKWGDESVTVSGTATTTGLVSHYAFTGNANDSFSTNHGTVTGATLTTDKDGNLNSAYLFTSTDYITLTNESAFDITTTGSWCFWVKRNGSTGSMQTVVGKSSGGNADGGYLVVFDNSGSNTVELWVSNGSTGQAGYCTLSNTADWTHVAVVYDGSLATTDRVKIYLDGVLQSMSFSGTVPASSSNNSRTPTIGVLPTGGSGSRMTLDDLYIYSTALTQSDVTAFVTASSTSSSSVTAVPYNYAADRRNYIGFGAFEEGDVVMIFPYTVTIDVRDTITYDGNDYRVSEVEEFPYAGSNLATAARLSRIKTTN